MFFFTFCIMQLYEISAPQACEIFRNVKNFDGDISTRLPRRKQSGKNRGKQACRACGGLAITHRENRQAITVHQARMPMACSFPFKTRLMFPYTGVRNTDINTLNTAHCPTRVARVARRSIRKMFVGHTSLQQTRVTCRMTLT